MTGEKIHLKLTEREMDYLLSMPSDPGTFILAFWRVALTAETFDTAESIDPSAYAIPKHQWKALCQHLTKPIGWDGEDRTIHSMQWVNIGPSGFDDSETVAA